MEVKLSKEVKQRVEHVAQTLGMEENQVVNQALILYLDTIKKHVELKKELEAWDRASDEALANFEKNLWKKEKSG